MVIELAKGIQRIARCLVDVVGDTPERQRHQWKWQQGCSGQAAVHAQAHHGHHHDQGQRAVKAGQHGFAGRHLHRVNVVGGKGHQVAGALLLEEVRSLLAQPRVEALAQLCAQPVAGGKQLQPPGHTQEVDGDAGQYQPRQLRQQGVLTKRPGHQCVNHMAHLAGYENRERAHRCQADSR